MGEIDNYHIHLWDIKKDSRLIIPRDNRDKGQAGHPMVGSFPQKAGKCN